MKKNYALTIHQKQKLISCYLFVLSITDKIAESAVIMNIDKMKYCSNGECNLKRRLLPSENYGQFTATVVVCGLPRISLAAFFFVRKQFFL